MATARSELDLTQPGTVDLGREAALLAARLPDLLIQARFIANTVAHGIHGRRRAGPGETFWQFRHFQSGEPAKRVDWRRSARDDHLYVREKEWEAAHTVWIWIDRSESMFFRSGLSEARKVDRAIVTALALTDLLIRGGERVGVVGLMRPTAQRQASRRLAESIARTPTDEGRLPDAEGLSRFCELVALGDFLDPLDEIEPALTAIAGRRVNGHLVQILDPAEETFPFAGRTEFHDPERGLRYVAGRAETMRDAFTSRMDERRRRFRRFADRLDWSHLVHHTDRPAQEPLLALHARLGAAGPGRGAGGAEGRAT